MPRLVNPLPLLSKSVKARASKHVMGHLKGSEDGREVDLVARQPWHLLPQPLALFEHPLQVAGQLTHVHLVDGRLRLRHQLPGLGGKGS